MGLEGKCKKCGSIRQRTEMGGRTVDCRSTELCDECYEWLLTGRPREITTRDAQMMTGWHDYIKTGPVRARQMDDDFVVQTLEGLMEGHAGDYLCIGPASDIWPVRKDIFESTYKKRSEMDRGDWLRMEGVIE